MARAPLGIAFRHLRVLFGGGSVAGLGDGALLARYRDTRDEAAFEALVGRHGPMVLATCRAILSNEHDVEDAFQATFLVLARKAGSVRGADALGGWLHRVAYRASVQASVEAKRRRRKEREASAMATRDVPTAGLAIDPDLSPIVHEEIDRLPEAQRLPVVLCDLEGLTYEQAAGQLGWTVPALRCRLARARLRLRARLSRRGFTAPAVVALVVPRGASTIVPAALVRSTVLAASGGATSAGAVLLAQALVRGMLMTQIKIATTAILVALALASAGWVVADARRAEDPEATVKPRADAAAREEPVVDKPAETVEAKGRVVAPDGRPVAGAVVTAVYFRENAPSRPRATSGPDGRFTIRLPRQAGDASDGYPARFPWLVASALGYGVGWAERALRPDGPAERELRLVEEGPPIEGRVVDLEGRSVAGARVQADAIWFDEKGDLAGWIARARRGAEGNLWQGLQHLSLDALRSPSGPAPGEPLVSITATTGDDGRFTLTGIGRDRIADLIISGPGVATTQFSVFSRAEPEIRSVERILMRPQPFIVHAPRFQLALPPSKRVEGVARDRDSGAPIAGLVINAAVFDESSLISARGIQARTGADGRYLLDGLPRATAYRLFITPDNHLPYLRATLKVPADSPGLEPVAFDFALKRGVVVRGRVTDKVTGRPIRGYANYYAFGDNPSVQDYPGFRSSYEQYAHFDDAGRYELVALPGRGIVAVRDESDRYRPASGYETIAGYDAKRDRIDAVPRSLSPRSQAIVTEIHLDPTAESAALDLQADPGRSVTVDVVDPDGGPLGGTKVKGQHELFQTGPRPQESSRFEVTALDPSTPRRVIVMHEGRKLIGTAFLKGDVTGPLTIKLQPWGSVAGRIVDDEGRPRKGVFINSPGGSENKHPETHDILPWSDWNQGIRVGDDGRFHVEGLVPGLKYGANARAGFEAFGELFIDVTVAPGEAKDLGDLKVQPPKKPQED
jgi:RNA polymerase sigma factor (sigma-70 family)